MPDVFVYGRKCEIVETDRFSNGYLTDTSIDVVYVPRGQVASYQRILGSVFSNDNHVQNYKDDPTNPGFRETFDAYEESMRSVELPADIPGHVKLDEVLRRMFSK